VFQNQIRKDTIVKSSGKVINLSGNTNPFNHNKDYIKLYTSLKDGTSKDEFGQLINPQYLDGVFNSATVLNWVRKVHIQVGQSYRTDNYIYLREVEVFNNEGVNVAKGKPATQSSTLNDKHSNTNKAELAVDGKFDTFSHTNNDSKYHISACNFPKYHVIL
jgi:hypothetical protein